MNDIPTLRPARNASHSDAGERSLNNQIVVILRFKYALPKPVFNAFSREIASFLFRQAS